MALSELGITRFISSIKPSDGSTEADVLALHYDNSRDSYLRDFTPRFARFRKKLALVGQDLVTNWAYTYAYPSDCLRVYMLPIAGIREPRLDQSVSYEKANLDGSIVIHTDQEDAEIIYTARVTDTEMFDPMVTMAIANLLGSRAGMPLTANGAIANNLLQAYYALASNACAADLNESNPGPPPMSATEASRL